MAPDLTITMSLPMVLAAAIMKPPNAPPAFPESIEVYVPFKCVCYLVCFKIGPILEQLALED